MAVKSHNKSEVIGMVVGVLISVLVMMLVSVSKGGLKVAGRASLVVFLAAFALWVTEPPASVGAPMADNGNDILKRAVISNDSVSDN